MGVVAAVLFVVLLSMSLLATLNWSLLAATADISLGFTQVHAPLGLVMLGLTAIMGLFFFAYVIFLQGSILFETRRHTKEMQAQRELADRAEASRFTELRGFLNAQESAQMARHVERHDALLLRIGQLEDRLRA
ncbi:LapA family protein [Variovorax sp. Sphag1AA]|uniref:LapA family protein n=1 Tax=Variovorax sp. Sphag1AA TaxID=2587027 RepID=UPI00160A1855|nr:LapA family protein [Variovorax sp. Sphag1AA]MBB3179796.1 putative integral membrane protein [Variovorax sp. Sphag1AA]